MHTKTSDVSQRTKLQHANVLDVLSLQLRTTRLDAVCIFYPSLISVCSVYAPAIPEKTHFTESIITFSPLS